MGFFDKVKNVMGIEEVDEDDDELEEEPKRTSIVTPRPPEVRNAAPSPAPAAAPKQEVNKATFSARQWTNQFKLVVKEPEGFDECPKLVDSLKAKKPVIINLENLETDIARKIFDFLSGATYALNGNVQKIANNIFIFAPENVDVAYKDQKASDSVRNLWTK